MENSFAKASGTSLCLGSLISIVTMALHPTEGSIQHIVRIQNVLIFSHTLAIACLPFMCFGALGLSATLRTDSRISLLAFIVFGFGLVAGMIAAAINGLILPKFLSDSLTKPFDDSQLKTVLRYGHHINTAMTNVFIFATSVSIAIWCILIIRLSQLPGWVGYWGLLLLGFELVCLVIKVNFTDLYGFRIFVFGLATWLIAVGIQLRSK